MRTLGHFVRNVRAIISELWNGEWRGQKIKSVLVTLIGTLRISATGCRLHLLISLRVSGLPTCKSEENGVSCGVYLFPP